MTFNNNKINLSNHISFCQLGFGTYQLTDQKRVTEAINTAFKAGYRTFDTAQLYQNEKQIGLAIKQCQINRKALFINTKIANTNQGYENTLRSFEKSLSDLKLDYIDLLLVHWPLSNHFFDTWKALEHIYEQKSARAIGVCNFDIMHLELLSTRANIKPMLNQIELHPYFSQKILVDYLRQENIAIQAWSPLAQRQIIGDQLLVKLGKKYQKTPSQVALRWHIQQGFSAIPKSSHPERIYENSRIFDFTLSGEDMIQLNLLNRNLRIGPIPNQVYRHNGF